MLGGSNGGCLCLLDGVAPVYSVGVPVPLATRLVPELRRWQDEGSRGAGGERGHLSLLIPGRRRNRRPAGPLRRARATAPTPRWRRRPRRGRTSRAAGCRGPSSFVPHPCLGERLPGSQALEPEVLATLSRPPLTSPGPHGAPVGGEPPARSSRRAPDAATTAHRDGRCGAPARRELTRAAGEECIYRAAPPSPRDGAAGSSAPARPNGSSEGAGRVPGRPPQAPSERERPTRRAAAAPLIFRFSQASNLRPRTTASRTRRRQGPAEIRCFQKPLVAAYSKGRGRVGRAGEQNCAPVARHSENLAAAGLVPAVSWHFTPLALPTLARPLPQDLCR